MHVWSVREGRGTLLQYSWLENPMDGGAWWAAVHGVAKSQTRLKLLSSRSSWSVMFFQGSEGPKQCPPLVLETSALQLRKVVRLQLIENNGIGLAETWILEFLRTDYVPKEKLGGFDEYKMPKKVKNDQDFTIEVKIYYWQQKMYLARRIICL